MSSIYLSPSTQENNVGAGSYGTEEQRMNQIMDRIEADLQGRFTLYRNRPGMTLQQVVADSNAKKPDLHFALHSNAGGGSGAECWISAKGGQAEQFAKRLMEEMSALTPGKDRGVKVSTSLYEVNKTKAPAVILEVEFHDTPEGAAWIVANEKAIAQACVRAILGYFGAGQEGPTAGTGPAARWYEKELAQAVAAGITDGTRPDDYCTRAEAAIMVLRGLAGK
ncbi:MAG TPA: N-acetylmuramoyl-L-alanine amidase [Firmicutes bacterium]|nr:N-acetylmuramoyl-L-alanine amidase [Bacillota bacterium]